MLKARLKSRLRESREEGFADLWHQVCLKRQTAGRAHESNSEFLGHERFQQLLTHVRAFHSDFLGRFSDATLAKLLEIAIFHSCLETDVIAVQAQRSTSMFVIVSGSVALFHKKSDHGQGNGGENGGASKLTSTEVEPTGSAEKAEKRDDDLSSDDDDEPHVDAKTNKSGYLQLLDWRTYPDGQASRFRKYFCVLNKGSLQWFESKDSVRVVGSEDVASAEHCMLLAPGTVGYKKTAQHVRESEIASLCHCFELNFVVQGSTHPRRTVFLAKSFDSSLAWVKAVQSWMDIPAEEVASPISSPLGRRRPERYGVRNRHFLLGSPLQRERRGNLSTVRANPAEETEREEEIGGAARPWTEEGNEPEKGRQRQRQRRGGVTMGLSPSSPMRGSPRSRSPRSGKLGQDQEPTQKLNRSLPRQDFGSTLRNQESLRKQGPLRKQGSLRSIGSGTRQLLIESSGKPAGELERQPSGGGGMMAENLPSGRLLQLEGGESSSAMLAPPRRKLSMVVDCGDFGPETAGEVHRGGTTEQNEQTVRRARGRTSSVILSPGKGISQMGKGMESMSPGTFGGGMFGGGMFETNVASSVLPGISNGLGDRQVQVKGINVAAWHKARNQSQATAWAGLREIFGEPICVLEGGDSFGEGTMLVDRRRMSSAVALTEVRVLELSKTALMAAALYDVVLHGMVWASPIVYSFLRPHPLLRQISQISVILSVVADSPFFQQLPIETRRGLLEGGHLQATTHGKQILGSYTPPFSHRSPPPLYIILHGRVEVHQGPHVLSEAMAGLQSCSVQEIQHFFPRKGQVLLAEEAWGGPLVWTDLRSLQVHKLQEQIPLEKDANKAHRLRQQLWSLQEAFTYTLVATEETTYLRIDPHDWIPVLSGVRDVVFRATTLHQILKKPPRQRAPQQARLITSLLQGFTALQQLPLSLVLKLAYEMEFYEARAGKLLIRQGQPVDGVFLLMQGTAGVFTDDGYEEDTMQDFEIGSMLEREEVGLFFGEEKGEMVQGAWFGEEAVRSGEVARESVITSDDCKILLIPAKAFRKETTHTNLGTYDVIDNRARSILTKEPNQRNKEEQDLLADALGGVGWLKELDKPVRRRIADVVKLKRVENGEILAKQGSFTETLAFIVSGSVSVHHLGVGIEEPGHMAEGFDLTTPMSEEHSWVYAPLTAKWGKCIAVLAAGGSIGELGFAMGSERGSSVMTREPTEYFCLEKESLGHELMYLLKVHLRTKHGIPASIRKPPGTRTEYDMVRLIAFLNEHPFLNTCTEKILGQVAQLVEFFTYEPGQVIQSDKENEKMLHIVDGGRVRLHRVMDAGRALAAKFKMKFKKAKIAKNQLSRRMLLQELSVMTAKARRRESTVPGELSRNLTQKPLPMPTSSSEEESLEPTKTKLREMKQLQAMEKSESKKALLKVFSSSSNKPGTATRSRRASLESATSDEGRSRSNSPTLFSPMVRAGAKASPAQPPGRSPLLGLHASRRRSDSGSPIQGVASGRASLASPPSSRPPSVDAGLASQTSSAAAASGRISRTSSAKSNGVLLDWGKHFVLGEAVAETRAQILRMPYSRWLHLQKVSGTLEKLDAANFFSRLKCFAPWNKKELAHLADKVKMQHFARDCTVVKKGEEPASLLFLKKGRCVLTQQALPSYNNLGGSEMAEDDRLYRVQKRKDGEGKDYQQRITAGKLFRCPACQEQAKPKGKGKQHHLKKEETDVGVCKVCHGTRAIRPGAMSRVPAGKSGTESVVGKAVGTVLPNGLINCALERMDAPLDHEVVAAEDCVVYSIDLDHLMDLCDTKPKLLRALTEESQRVAKWHAVKHKDDILTRSALNDDVQQAKNPKVTGPLAGEQPNTEMWNRLYPQQPVLDTVIPHNMGSLSKSGRKGALLIGTWKNKTQMPNHRVDNQTKLLMHAAQGPQADSQISGDQSSLLEMGAEVNSGFSSFEHLRGKAGSDEEDPWVSGESDGLEDFFVTSGAGMAAEQNRMAWDEENGAINPSLAISVDESARQKAQSVIPTFERSQDTSVNVSRAPPLRSKSALDAFCDEEASKLLKIHLEVMVGGGMPTMADRWKRNSRKRRAGTNLRAVSTSPNCVDHIKTLQKIHAQQDLNQGGLNFNSPSKQHSPPTVMPPVHSATKKPAGGQQDQRAHVAGSMHRESAKPEKTGARGVGKDAAPAPARQLEDSFGTVEEPDDQDQELDGWGVVYGEEQVLPAGNQHANRSTPGSRRSKGSVRNRASSIAEPVLLPVRSFNMEL